MNTKILKLRKELHQNPELSGEEFNTVSRIREFIGTHNPTRLIENVGGNGLMAVYEYDRKGPVIFIRCELDALPIAEANTFGHRSHVKGISHKCGHDGHMAIVAGLITWIRKQDFKSGKIVLLFQPAEETGKGAIEVINDERFRTLNPDYIFALHNIPGESLNSIITVKSGFSAEVQSLAIHLSGKESHASEPENGINPSLAIPDILKGLSGLNVPDPSRGDFTILTPIHICMGEKAYGISPGNGEIHYTIRTWDEVILKKVKKEIVDIIKGTCQCHELSYKLDWIEYFPASVNKEVCNERIAEAVRLNGLKLIERPYPFKFGEDFGWYSKEYNTAMFGLGAGTNCPALHHADYDFPEEIIGTGVRIFASIIKGILQE